MVTNGDNREPIPAQIRDDLISAYHDALNALIWDGPTPNTQGMSPITSAHPPLCGAPVPSATRNRFTCTRPNGHPTTEPHAVIKPPTPPTSPSGASLSADGRSR